MRKFALLTIAAASLAACAPLQTTKQLVTPTGLNTVGPGSTVLTFRTSKSLPTPFGGRDPWGRTTYAGGTTVVYAGNQGDAAVFDSLTVMVDNNKSTLTETPLVMTSVNRQDVSGTVNGQAVTATMYTPSTTYIPPRPTQQWESGRQSFRFTLRAGESKQIEGRRLTVINVGANSVEYRVE